MWSFITRPLDRFAIRSACGSVLPSPDGQSHAEEAIGFLNQPDFFAPAVDAARVEIISKDAFHFISPVSSDSAVNNRVRGRFETADGNWQQKPSVILLHGWNAELQYQWQLPYWAQLLARAGINAFRFELPYHGSRRPTEPDAIRNFFSGNLLHFARAVHQSLADLRALALWLRTQGSPALGVWGVSLGGWLAGLAAAHQREFDVAALLTPVVRLDRAMDLKFCDPIRDSARGIHERFPPLNLINHQPLLRRGRMLFVAADFDLFAPPETIDELVAQWHPEVWRYPHGHISILFANRIMRRIARWLATSVGEP